MKKLILGVAVIAAVALVGAVVAVSAVSAYAQTNEQDPIATPKPWPAFRPTHMWGAAAESEGPLHDNIVAAVADALGMSATDLDAKLASGETLGAIAQDEGLSLDDFRALFVEARKTAIEKAQAEGVLTQDQARWMTQFMNGVGPNPDRIIGTSGNCPMWGDGDADEIGGPFGGMGMSGNRLGGRGFQRP